jgi:hypothetical protein
MAENWVEFNTSAFGSTKTEGTIGIIESYYDKDSIGFIGNGKYKVWTKEIRSYNNEFKEVFGDGESRTLVIIDCEKNSFEVITGSLSQKQLDMIPQNLRDDVVKMYRGSIYESQYYMPLHAKICNQ